MKRITENIVRVEDGDTLEYIAKWIHQNKTGNPERIVNVDEWLFVVKPGDIIIFNSPNGMYRLNETLKPLVTQLDVSITLERKRQDERGNTLRQSHLQNLANVPKLVFRSLFRQKDSGDS